MGLVEFDEANCLYIDVLCLLTLTCFQVRYLFLLARQVLTWNIRNEHHLYVYVMLLYNNHDTKSRRNQLSLPLNIPVFSLIQQPYSSFFDCVKKMLLLTNHNRALTGVIQSLTLSYPILLLFSSVISIDLAIYSSTSNIYRWDSCKMQSSVSYIEILLFWSASSSLFIIIFLVRRVVWCSMFATFYWLLILITDQFDWSRHSISFVSHRMYSSILKLNCQQHYHFNGSTFSN